MRTGRHQDLTIVALRDGNFAAQPSPARDEWSLAVHSRSGDVIGDLRASLAAAALPAPVIDEVIVAFTCDPDLPADPPPGSRFTVVYEALEGRGTGADAARLRYASLHSDGAEHRIYRYQMNGGEVAFVEASGRGVVPLRLAQPIDDAGVTSPWGWRMHPVLGVRKFHRGWTSARPPARRCTRPRTASSRRSVGAATMAAISACVTRSGSRLHTLTSRASRRGSARAAQCAADRSSPTSAPPVSPPGRTSITRS